MPNIICLSIDRLHAGYLGAYGNTWISTPAMDRLASESLVLDRMMIDSPDLDIQYRSLWLGRHAMTSSREATTAESLPVLLANHGWRTMLVTDDPAVANHKLAHGFEERIVVAGDAKGERPTVAQTVEETDAASFFAELTEQIHSPSREPFLLWAHTGTLGRIWDAPLELRAQYHDADDPPPDDWADVPGRVVTGEVDPDELLGLRHAYAGQVSMVDMLLGSFLEAADQLPSAAKTAFFLLSPRGFPLAEHRRIGVADDSLYAELTRAACYLRLPGGTAASQRSQDLVQPADLCATFLDLAKIESRPSEPRTAGFGRSILTLVNGEAAEPFDRAIAIASSLEQRIETPAWALRVSPASDPPTQNLTIMAREELFMKPDDWCEVNEVSDRCPEIVRQLQAVLAEFRQGCENGVSSAPATLPAELVSSLE